MTGIHRIDLGRPALLEFRGPDAVRFLNGQLTQDVRLVADGGQTLPSCVTDAKGRLQFRVWVTGVNGSIWVEGPSSRGDDLEARITRYLIADEVEVLNRSGSWSLVHFTGIVENAPDGVVVRSCQRFGVPGTDWWLPGGPDPAHLPEIPLLEGDDLETFRIARAVPLWGRELTEGLLPPEAGLDASDISYQKGCYIGQEVISRIKSAGKVNKRLAHFTFDPEWPVDSLMLVDANGESAGEITSISPLVKNGRRHALGYVKRGAEGVEVVSLVR